MNNSFKSSNFQKNTLYSDYEEWKGWDKKGLSEVPSATNHDYFSREMKRANISSGAKILEIGFGNGEFMQWAKVNGYRVSGVEVREKLYYLAKERKFCVFFHRYLTMVFVPYLRENSSLNFVGIEDLFREDCNRNPLNPPNHKRI